MSRHSVGKLQKRWTVFLGDAIYYFFFFSLFSRVGFGLSLVVLPPRLYSFKFMHRISTRVVVFRPSLSQWFPFLGLRPRRICRGFLFISFAISNMLIFSWVLRGLYVHPVLLRFRYPFVRKSYPFPLLLCLFRPFSWSEMESDPNPDQTL